jgi:hypothetical protein
LRVKAAGRLRGTAEAGAGEAPGVYFVVIRYAGSTYKKKLLVTG